MPASCLGTGVWTSGEHERFLEAIALYPRGPWTLITEHIRTRSIRQVQTHARKYQNKLMRHERGLIKRKKQSSRVEHRVDTKTAVCLTRRFIEWPAYRCKHMPYRESSSPSGADTYDLPRRQRNPIEALQSLISQAQQQASTTTYCYAKTRDHNPMAPVYLSHGDLEPLPFEAGRDLDEQGLLESVEFLETCGFLDTDGKTDTVKGDLAKL